MPPGHGDAPNRTPGASPGKPPDIMTGVATATAVDTGHAIPSVNRPNVTSVGTVIWLSSELMFFAALFAMYFTLRSVMGAEYWQESAEALNLPFSAPIRRSWCFPP